MYCTREDIFANMDISHIQKFLKNANDGGNEWETRLDNLIQSATLEIDGFVRNRYPVPLNPVPNFIKDICIRIVKYKIVMRRGFNKEAPEVAIVDDYKQCIKQLEKIATGEIDIGLEATKPQKVIYKTKKRTFDDDFWKGY